MYHIGYLNADSNIKEFAEVRRNIRMMYERGFINEAEYDERMQDWRSAVHERLHKHGYVGI